MIAFQIVITDYQNGRVVGSMESYEQAPTEVEKSVYDRFEFLFELMTTKPAKVLESDWLKDTYQPCPEPQPVKVICLHENIRSIWRRPAWYYCPDCGKYFDINMSEMKPDWLAGKRAT